MPHFGLSLELRDELQPYRAAIKAYFLQEPDLSKPWREVYTELASLVDEADHAVIYGLGGDAAIVAWFKGTRELFRGYVTNGGGIPAISPAWGKLLKRAYEEMLAERKAKEYQS